MTDIVRVLVVDDSAYVRKVVGQMLRRSPFVEVVGTARDGEEALHLAEELRPDVITCDLNMPIMDGVAFVRAQMARQAVAIVIISIAEGAGEQVLAALDAGAVDFVQKPTALATERLMEMAEELVEKVKAAARAPRRAARPVERTAPAPFARSRRPVVDVVVIGISTGGPQALKVLIPEPVGDLIEPIRFALAAAAGAVNR
jgi:two-component system chemotaxis response regulator CheB